MNFIDQNFRKKFPPFASDETENEKYFAFFGKPSPENLSANRSGILTSQQYAFLKVDFENQKANNLILTGMLIFTGLFMCFLFWKIDMEDGTLSMTGEILNAGFLIVVLSIFEGWLTRDWYVFFPGDDLNNRVVETATGTVEWTGRRYRMRTPGRVLRTLQLRVTLLPGNYRFYYLPHTGLVVMAEQLQAVHRDEPASILYQALSNANRFSADELSQNHKGLLSESQENHLLSILAFYALIFIISAVLFVNMASRIVQGAGTTMFVMLLIISILLGVRFGWSSLRILLDVWRGEVRHIDGRVSRRTRHSRYHTTFLYVVDRYKFEVSAAAYEALIEGPEYRIFFVPFSERLVSIEPLQILKEANNDLPDHTT